MTTNTRVELVANILRRNGFNPVQDRISSFLKWCPHKPHKQQLKMLNSTAREGLFGGAAGGGKSDELLMEVCGYLDTPGFAALLLRRTFSALMQPDALIPRSKEWWSNTAAKWDAQEHQWTFPSGALVKFGYLQTDNDVYQYQSAAYQYIAFDELTQFSEFQYTYLFSRQRRLEGVDIPLKMRSATNPDGIGVDWVRERFVTISVEESKRHDRMFVPSKLSDNPSLDQEAYLNSLSYLDPITKKRLLEGDWSASEGAAFPDFVPAQWHVIPTQTIPDHWKKFAGHDWGYESPGHHVWAAQVPPGDNGSEIIGPGMVIYREFKFDHLEPHDIADSILQMQFPEKVNITWAGMDIFHEHRARLTVMQMQILEERGALQMSIHDNYVQRGLYCLPGYTPRVAGRQGIHAALKATDEGVPWLRIMDCCPVLIKSLKNIQIDEHNNEDVRTDYPPNAPVRDDAYDALRYLIMGVRRANITNKVNSQQIPVGVSVWQDPNNANVKEGWQW